MTARILDSKSVKETTLILLISTITSMIAGIALGLSDEMLLIIPGLIVLIPGSINTRGAIYAALGSRLGSSMHLGIIQKFSFKSHIVRKNIYSSFSLNYTFSIILGLIAWAVSFFIGLDKISPHSFIFISVIGGIISGLALMGLTFFISFKSFKRGWDPDNVTSPFITTFADVITIPSLLLAVLISFSAPFIDFIAYAIVVIAIIEIAHVFLKNADYKPIIKQSFAALLVSGFLSSASGIIIELNITQFVAIAGLLVLFPAFIGNGGSIGNVFSSRLSTKLHLGAIRPGFGHKQFRREVMNSYITSIIIFPFIGAMVFIFSNIFSITTIPFLDSVIFTLLAGILLMTIVIIVGSFMAFIAYRLGLDPDNIMIPVVTGVADISGIYALFLILVLFGVV